MRARIAGWQIGDGDLEAPVPGEVLHGLSLRLVTTVSGTPGQPGQVVEGTISWARVDQRNGVVETKISADGFSVLTQDPAAAAHKAPEIGTRVRRSGSLHSIGSYEFDAFELPAVTEEWRVLAVEQVGVDDVMVDIEPVEFRVNG